MAVFKSILQSQDLKRRIGFTLLLLALCRVGSFIPVPGINTYEALAYFKASLGAGQNMFQLVDIFTGGAFSRMSIVALGVMPYIQASIALQLLTALIPSVQREMKEAPDLARRKIGKWTRWATVALAFFQSYLQSKFILGSNLVAPGIILPELLSVTFYDVPVLFYCLTIATMTTASLLLMWIGEQISEHGVGNGVSLIITLGILSSLPTTIGSILRQLNLESPVAGQLSFSSVTALIAVFVAITMGTILIILGQRRLPLQYARGSSSSSNKGSHIPLKINFAGVIPVIFASAILMAPAFIHQYSYFSALKPIAKALSPGSLAYTATYAALIVFFTFFWTETQFHPDAIASDMKRSSSFIPGIKQGKETEDYIKTTMRKVTLLGALFLALIAILPVIVSRILHVDPQISYFFGGTSLLITIGVILDTKKQIDSLLIMNKYGGLMTSKKTNSIV